MSFLTGVFVAQEFLGSGVLAIARFTPSYWYIRSNDMLMWITSLKEADMVVFWQGIGIQLGFAIALLAVAFVIGKEKKLRLLTS